MTMSHLAEMIIQFYDDPGSFHDWLEMMHNAGVIQSIEIDGDIIRIHGQVSTCLWRKVDPVNNLVCLALALFGPFWVFMSDKDIAFKKVKQWWRSQIKRTSSVKKSKKQRTLENWSNTS